MATLYGQADNFRTQKVQAAAAIAGTKLTVKGDPPADVSPLGVTPAVQNGKRSVSGDAGCLWEVAGDKLKGQNKEDAAAVVAWLQMAESEFAPAILGWVLPSVSVLQMSPKAVEDAKAATKGLLAQLNKALLSKTFLVGERLSLADISLAFNLLPAYQHVMDAATRKAFQNVTRWFRTVLATPECQSAAGGPVALCQTPAVFDAAKYAQNAPKAAPKKEEKKKADKPKPKKEEPAEEPDAAEQALAEEPKRKDPFEAFGKPSFNLEEFKRVYSNEDTEAKALPYLHDNIDWPNWSVWHAEYKYPEDLGLVFMSCNLISGMMQRLDKLRKSAFASICLFGENNASTISGIWIWRGDQLAFTLSPDWQVDFESYAWTKLDPKDDKTKKMIKEYFCWEGDFDGKKFNQGKIFK